MSNSQRQSHPHLIQIQCQHNIGVFVPRRRPPSSCCCVFSRFHFPPPPSAIVHRNQNIPTNPFLRRVHGHPSQIDPHRLAVPFPTVQPPPHSSLPSPHPPATQSTTHHDPIPVDVSKKPRRSSPMASTAIHRHPPGAAPLKSVDNDMEADDGSGRLRPGDTRSQRHRYTRQ